MIGQTLRFATMAAILALAGLIVSPYAAAADTLNHSGTPLMLAANQSDSMESGDAMSDEGGSMSSDSMSQDEGMQKGKDAMDCDSGESMTKNGAKGCEEGGKMKGGDHMKGESEDMMKEGDSMGSEG